MIQAALWLPLAAGVLAALVPRKATPWVAVAGAGAALAIGVGLLASFDSNVAGLQHPVDESWIPDLGVRYSIGIDGLNVFLTLLASVSWFAVTLWSAFHPPERDKTWFFLLGLAHTGTLGAFMAQDLLLFVLFFDLMLIPFFFLFAGWGEEHEGRDWEKTIQPGPATIKMVVYTLVGSLLMLAAAIATGVIAGGDGTPEFSMSALAADPISEGSQRWIFWFFAAAFLVKMPAFLVHGWMADAYRTAPLPALALFSAVLSKVGAYGFLKVVLPIYPEATVQFQEVLLVVAVASILYGSIMAFSQTSARLVLGYSSIAQLGFITLGVFALRADGADGAILQMVNHGLVTVPLMLLFVVLVERTRSDDISRMGGLALRAPVMAALFLVLTMALLAIPGSANFIGEFFILNGTFGSKPAFALVATLGVAMAAYYALRLYQHAMHNRKRDFHRISRDRMARGRDRRRAGGVHRGAGVLPAGGPRAHRRKRRGNGRCRGSRQLGRGGERPVIPIAQETFNAPEIDYAGLSPVIALTVGLVAVLMIGLLKTPRWVMPALTIAALGAAGGLAIWQWGEQGDLVSGALRLDEFGLSAVLIAVFAGSVATLLSIREPAAEDAGLGAFYALLIGSVLGMTILAMAQNLMAFFVGLELLSIPLYVMCGAAIRKEASLESGLKYLIIGSLGSATLLYGFAFIYGAGGSTDYNAIAETLAGGEADDSIVLIGVAMAAVGLAFKVSLAPFHQWTPDVYQGAPTPVTAFMAVATKAAAFIAFARLFEVALGPVADDWDGALAALALVSIVVGNIGALGQDSLKRLLGYSGVAQAGYMLAGIVVASEIGLEALVFYLAAYTLMNLAIFPVIVARERESEHGDDIKSFEGIGRTQPWLAWPMTIGFLALAGVPATTGFIGKLYLIEATVDGGFTWLGVAIVIGTMVSMAYYLRVLAAVWMKPAAEAGAMPAIAGASPEADAQPKVKGASRCGLIVGAGMVCAGATVFFGVIPSPLVDWAASAGESLASFI